MGSDTDRLPQLDDDSLEFVDTIVLEESDIMETQELRALIDPDAATSADEDDAQDDGP